jgi:hypothetical protein
MSGSSILVITNALRLMRAGRTEDEGKTRQVTEPATA